MTLETAQVARRNLMRRHAHVKNTAPKFAVGDLVRISREKNIFEKGYESGWTLEIFKVYRISQTRPPVVYFLKDLLS